MNHDESRSQDNGGQGSTLLGAPSRRGPMNVFPLWKNILVPNRMPTWSTLCGPEHFPARSCRSDSLSRRGCKYQCSAEGSGLAVLDKAGVAVIGIDEDDGSLLVRLQDEAAQLGARSLIANTLNRNAGDFVVALAQAPTTPQWLQDIGGKPMSLGLDLFGGAHFLLQVNMRDYITGVVDSAEGMRDKLIDERIRFLTENGSTAKPSALVFAMKRLERRPRRPWWIIRTFWFRSEKVPGT